MIDSVAEKKFMRGYIDRLINSNSYNRSLKQRGRIDFWLDESIYSNWYYTSDHTPGGKTIYSNAVIELILILSWVYHQPLRQTEGFMQSLIDLSGKKLKVPDYTTLCRRRQTLDVSHKLDKWNGKENIVFSVDASGLKCCGEKEWMRKKHKVTRKRKFVKIHTGINTSSKHILFNKVTSSRKHDGSILPEAVEKLKGNLKTLLADGGYDFKSSYGLTAEDVNVIIPPRSNAVVDHKTSQRNQAIEYISENSKAKWKRETDYHRRSLVENVFSRWKTIFGENITTKNDHSRQVEVTLKSVILNKMTDIGMPQWKRIYLLN